MFLHHFIVELSPNLEVNVMVPGISHQTVDRSFHMLKGIRRISGRSFLRAAKERKFQH